MRNAATTNHARERLTTLAPAEKTALPLESPLRGWAARSRPVAHERPTLGSMPRSRRRHGGWLLAAVDLATAAIVLAFVLAATGTASIAAVVAPVLFVGIEWGGGAYRLDNTSAEIQGAHSTALVRVLAAAVLAWSASMLAGDSLTVLEQLAIFAGAVLLCSVGARAAAPAVARLRRPERWVLIADAETAERLRAYAPLADHARIVYDVSLSEQPEALPDRSAALRVVDANSADRVVIASRVTDGDGLADLIRKFQSVGVPVSLLPRPLDRLETPTTRQSRIGGLPLLDVGAGTAQSAVPYTGPDRRRARQTKVSVVIPAINEEGSITGVLERLPEGLHEVILVDGNSHDRTVEVAIANRPDIRVLTQPGRGKGDALRAGFAAVTGNLIVMLDADGSAAPEEIPRFVAALEDGADFAKGSRFLEGGGSDDITALRRLGNSALNLSANALHGTHFTDLCYGYNAFWARCLPFVSLDVPGFEVETLINLRMAAAGMRIREVPSYEADRTHGTTNLNTFRDGWRVLRTILRESKLNVFRWAHHSGDRVATAPSS